MHLHLLLQPGLVLVAIATLSLLVTLLSHASAHLLLSRRKPHGRSTPAVSILKPLKGLDEGLHENLTSLAHQEYPKFELLFGAEDPDDPALLIAEQVRRENPGVAISIWVCAAQRGLNPKVSNLSQLAERALHPVLLISDSNVRVGSGYLRDTADELADPRVGLVTNMLVGIGERSLAARLENLHLNTWVIAATSLPRVLAGRACVIGKSMLFRKVDLELLGGFAGVRDVLAEDYVLGRKFELAGFKVALSTHLVPTVNEEWTLTRLLNRHLRWGQMRRRVAPAAFLGEALLNPLPLVAAAAAVDHTCLGAAAACTLVKLSCDALLHSRVRGRFPTLLELFLLPLKDLLMATLWLVAGFRRKLSWRGNELFLSAGSVLSCEQTGAQTGDLEPQQEAA